MSPSLLRTAKALSLNPAHTTFLKLLNALESPVLIRDYWVKGLPCALVAKKTSVSDLNLQHFSVHLGFNKLISSIRAHWNNA
jgi:hypothetical protein